MVLPRSVSSEGAFMRLILGYLLGGCWAESCLTGTKLRTKLNFQFMDFEKFGCNFRNTKYDMHTDSIFNPVYGTRVGPLDFDNVTEFDEVLNVIDQEHSNVMNDLVSTNIPEFFHFYNAYKKQYLKTFERFFKKYVPPFFPNQGTASMAIELLNRLVGRFPKMWSNAHLITSSPDYDEKLLHWLVVPKAQRGDATNDADIGDQSLTAAMAETEKIANSSDNEPPKLLFRHDHVAALLRISIQGRRGYVLMDPELKLERPIVIMADEKHPHRPGGRKYGRGSWEDIDFNFHRPHKEYLYARYESSTDIYRRNYMYYIGKPYCSFLMTTAKTAITKHFKYMVRSDSKGLEMASLKFNVAQIPPMFIARLRKDTGTEKWEVPIEKLRSDTGKLQYNISAESLRSNSRTVPIELQDFPENVTQYYNQWIKTLNYDAEIFDLIRKVKIITEDEYFIRKSLDVEKDIDDVLHDIKSIEEISY